MRYTTVRGYLCHVKVLWRDAGCPKKRLHSVLLRSVMRGIRRALPALPDKRATFVLLNLTLPGYYFNQPSSRWLLATLVVFVNPKVVTIFFLAVFLKPKVASSYISVVSEVFF